MSLFEKQEIKPVSEKRFKIGISLLVITTLLSTLLIIDDAADMVSIVMPAIIVLVAVSAPRHYINKLTKEFYLNYLEPILWLAVVSSFILYLLFLRLDELVIAAIFYPLFILTMFILGIQQTDKLKRIK
jgi:uncharacterized membrane protein YoaK (UPF0700 family)